MNSKVMHRQMLLERTAQALTANGMPAQCFEDSAQLLVALQSLIGEGDTVGIGGSMTLFETGVIDWLREQPINLLDRYREGLAAADIDQLYRDSFAADVYLTSSNAITESGHLYNVDGRGNRVAAMIYGPKKVIVIAGSNKIVVDDQAAIVRNKRIAAPTNAMRLNRRTPCASLGYCTDCTSPERICSVGVFHRKQMTSNRIHVLLLADHYGY